jgi:hypothetical protein
MLLTVEKLLITCTGKFELCQLMPLSNCDAIENSMRSGCISSQLRSRDQVLYQLCSVFTTVLIEQLGTTSSREQREKVRSGFNSPLHS